MDRSVAFTGFFSLINTVLLVLVLRSLTGIVASLRMLSGVDERTIPPARHLTEREASEAAVRSRRRQ